MAVVHLKRAIELDPEYGRAYAALSMTYWLILHSGPLDALGLTEIGAFLKAGENRVLALKYGPTSLSYQAESWVWAMRYSDYEKASAEES